MELAKHTLGKGQSSSGLTVIYIDHAGHIGSMHIGVDKDERSAWKTAASRLRKLADEADKQMKKLGSD